MTIMTVLLALVTNASAHDPGECWMGQGCDPLASMELWQLSCDERLDWFLDENRRYESDGDIYIYEPALAGAMNSLAYCLDELTCTQIQRLTSSAERMGESIDDPDDLDAIPYFEDLAADARAAYMDQCLPGGPGGQPGIMD